MKRLQKKLERVDPPLKPLQLVTEKKLNVLINHLLNYARQQGVVNNNYIDATKIYNLFTIVGIRDQKVNGSQVFLHNTWDLVRDTCDALCTDEYGYLLIKCEKSGPRRPTYRYNGIYPIAYLYGVSLPPSPPSASTPLEDNDNNIDGDSYLPSLSSQILEPNDNIDVESSDSRSSVSNGTAMDIELFNGDVEHLDFDVDISRIDDAAADGDANLSPTGTLIESPYSVILYDDYNFKDDRSFESHGTGSQGVRTIHSSDIEMIDPMIGKIEDDNDWMNTSDRDCSSITDVVSPNVDYKVTENPNNKEVEETSELSAHSSVYYYSKNQSPETFDKQSRINSPIIDSDYVPSPSVQESSFEDSCGESSNVYAEVVDTTAVLVPSSPPVQYIINNITINNNTKIQNFKNNK